MLASILSATLHGLDGRSVRVEVDVAPGLPGFTIVGLADTALQEARERVRGAIRNSGYEYPPRRITVNLAPADLRKSGASLDLAIALGILVGSEQVAANGRWAVLGELSLGGDLRARSRACCPWLRPWPGAERGGSWSRWRAWMRRGSRAASKWCRPPLSPKRPRCSARTAAAVAAADHLGWNLQRMSRRTAGSDGGVASSEQASAPRRRIWPRSGVRRRRAGQWNSRSPAATAW